MPETLLSDEQILGLDDSTADAPSEVLSETSEASAPVETQAEETAPLRPESAKDETLPLSKKQADKTQQPVKPAKDGTQKQPQDISEVNAAKAAELDRADSAFLNSDYSGMARTFEQMFADNPHACGEALWMGMRFLEQHAPAELAGFSRFVVADALGKQGLWDFLEDAFNVAKANPEKITEHLQHLAGFLHQQYGLGPARADAQEVSWQNYTKNVGALLEQTVDGDIKRAFGAEFSAVPPQLQEELLTAAQFAVKDSLLADRDLGPALQKLQKGYTINEGVKLFLDVLDPKVRAMIPRVAQSLRAQYGDLFKKAAPIPQKTNSQPTPAPAELPPSSLAEARARGMNLSQILKATQSELEQADADNVLGREEAATMSDRDILNSPRRADLSKLPSKRSATLKKSEARNMSFAQILSDERPLAAGE